MASSTIDKALHRLDARTVHSDGSVGSNTCIESESFCHVFTLRSRHILLRGSRSDMNAGFVSPWVLHRSTLPRHSYRRWCRFGSVAPLHYVHLITQSLPTASTRNVAPEFSILKAKLFYHGFGIDEGSLGGRFMLSSRPTLTAFLSTGMQIVP